MAVYAVGDVQGCHDELADLIELLDFDPGRDEMWLVGDLVNRGPRSLDVLRLVRGLGDAAHVVLGNHDLHLIAAAAGVRALRRRDTFGDVLEAPDRDELVTWLRGRPMLHHDAGVGFTMVHAGLPPQWSIEDAMSAARELETAIRESSADGFLGRMYGDEPARWSDDLHGVERLRFITNAFTRMRFVDRCGRLDFEQAGPPGSQREGLVPWYEAPARASRGARIVFGHWATLQNETPLSDRHGVWHVDTGCVWGGRLTALRLDDLRTFSVPSRTSAPRN